MKRKILITISILCILAATLYFLLPVKPYKNFDNAENICITLNQPILKNGNADILSYSYDFKQDTEEYEYLSNILLTLSCHRTWNTCFSNGSIENADTYILVNAGGTYVQLSDTGEILMDGHNYLLWGKETSKIQEMIDFLLENETERM